VQIYLDKLNLVIPKYQPEYPLVGLSSNPALAGPVENRLSYFRLSLVEPWKIPVSGFPDHPIEKGEEAGVYRETLKLGFSLPLSKSP
jgi:hypothetical protein